MVYPVSFTTPQIEGLTRNALLKDVGVASGLMEYGIATSGSTSTIVDTTRYQSTQYSDKDWEGGWARISKDAGGAAAAPEAEIRPITTYAPTTGTFTVNPVFSAAVAAGDEFELWRVDPRLVLDIIDRCLIKDLFFPCWSLCSECPDFDMEQSVTTDWTASNTTHTKETTEPVMNGKRYSKSASSAAGGYIRPPLFSIEPGKRYHVSVSARAGSGATAKLLIYDETNSAEITSETSVRRYPHRVWTEFTTPSTCYQISVRLANVETSVTVEWDDLVIFELGGRSIALPWWVKNKDQVLGVFDYEPRALSDNIWIEEFIGHVTDRYDFQDTAFGRGQLRLTTRHDSIQRPVLIFGARNEIAYANDNSDTKRIDNNLLVACVSYRLYESMMHIVATANIEVKYDISEFVRWKDTYELLQRQHMERIEQVISSPEPWVKFPSEDRYGNLW